MKYDFPIINNVNDVYPAIEDSEEFNVYHRGDFLVANYAVRFADTFPPINSVNDAIRRECRGMIFDAENGDLIRRPYHKFFNINEVAETQDHLIDVSEPHVIMEKMDGSMFSPFWLGDDIAWGTKMGITDVSDNARKFVDENEEYNSFAGELIDEYTPIFEWCSRSLRIVIDHPEDRLVLTAVRNIRTGEYMTYDEMCRVAKRYRIPVVPVYDSVTDLRKFIDYSKGLDQTEGFVMRFEDGHMLKFKCEWYVDIHKMKDMVSNERKVVRLILTDALDDVKAFLDHGQVEDLERYERDFGQALIDECHATVDLIGEIREKYEDRKDFAVNGNMEQYPALRRSMIFKSFDTPLTFDKYYATIKEMLLSDMTNRRFREIKDSLFPRVKFHIR